ERRTDFRGQYHSSLSCFPARMVLPKSRIKARRTIPKLSGLANLAIEVITLPFSPTLSHARPSRTIPRTTSPKSSSPREKQYSSVAEFTLLKACHLPREHI